MGLIISAAIFVMLFLFFIFAFYFTLNFIEYLHKKDERVVKQSKYAALVCFGVSIAILVGSGYLALFYHLL
ncbi:hypothetical protein [Lentibacillus cibarius]|uniref:Uncharacterized protein n=1 Tax=Lentibacillus cibarius TaxID=2583219 RepID=A0A5S3QJQ7_9BACI|nr:hypothetical protein [Lentibacillus cibarius]TMN22095.1 hypothetical protein FFL34_08135 [Lentibacillus cibarius]